jgi:threonyl-tRNA synthetase
MAVQKLFPETKVTIGPVVDNGFYYDFDRKEPFTLEDLGKIETEMRRIIKANLPIIREEVEREQIKAEIEQLGEPYKLEILYSIPEVEIITRYFIGNPDSGRWKKGEKPEPSLIETATIEPDEFWWDLCAEPHLNFTGEINLDAFALESSERLPAAIEEKTTI